MNVLEYLLEVTFLVAMPILIFLGWRWQFRKAESRLKKWAEQSGYRIIDRSYRLLFRGPFLWTSVKGQAVYGVHIEDQDGRQRQGWVRFGSWWWGMWSDRVDVLWDEPRTGQA
jgi:hypothetical protein